MAEVDLSIYRNLLAAPKSIADYDNEFAQQQSNALDLKAKRQSFADDQAYREAAKGFGTDVQGNYNALLQKGLPAQAAAYQKAAMESRKSMSEIDLNGSKKNEADAVTAEKARATKQAMYQQGMQILTTAGTPEQAARMINDGVRKGYWSMQDAQQKIGEMQQNPDFMQWRTGELHGLMSANDRLEMERKQQADAAMNKYRQGELGIQRGQLGVSQGNLGLARERLAYDKSQPKGQIVQSDQGAVLVDPRTGKSTPVMAPDGTPLAPKLKDLPTAASAAIMNNAQNINKVQQAIDLIDGKDVGALKGDKNATGWKGYAPQAVLNRADPSGVDTRAMITDIGSLVLHDRSGAAVTASESPRLMPFIPLATDDQATARKKLARFKQVYEQEQQAYLDTYSKDQGYKTPKVPTPGAPNPAAPKPIGGNPKPATEGAAKQIATDAEYNALPSGATFISPDGKTRRKP